MTIRTIALSLAGLAIGAMLSFASAPASAACGIHQGGECGRDAIFRPGEPRRGSNIRTHVDRNQYRDGRRHGNVGNQRGHNRAATANRSRGTTTTARSFRNVTLTKTGSFRVLTGQTVERCMRNVRTGEVVC